MGELFKTGAGGAIPRICASVKGRFKTSRSFILSGPTRYLAVLARVVQTEGGGLPELVFGSSFTFLPPILYFREYTAPLYRAIPINT